MVRRFSLALIASVAIVLVACGSSARPSTVTITVQDDSMNTSIVQFRRGASYHFVIKNLGTVTHELMIMPHMDTMGMSMDQMHHLAYLMVDAIAPGQTKTVDYVFPTNMLGNSMPMQDTTLEMACHLPGHYEAGLKATVMLVP